VSYYPICLELKGRRCLVIGGGGIAEHKVNSLLACEALVTVISPEVTPGLKDLIDQKKVAYRPKKYEEEDLDRAFLVIAATNRPEVNAQVYRDASRRNILVNVVDCPKYCNFIVPALIKRGDLLLSISTSGKSPALAKKIREKLEREFGEEYETFLKIIGELREKIYQRVKDPYLRRTLINQILDSDLLDLLKKGELRSAQEKKLSILKGLGLQN
jgi:precorrin-2 dehydrogenase/sirohydrochlorin ferrochelatase